MRALLVPRETQERQCCSPRTCTTVSFSDGVRIEHPLRGL
jgi:hypothetical protein